MKKFLIRFSIILILCIFVILTLIYLLFPLKYKDIIAKYSEKYNLDKSLVVSVINIESGFKKDSVSKVGAVGLMQLLPSTAEDVMSRLKINKDDVDLFDIETNIHLGCYYLSYLLKLYDNNVINSLCAYNWGLNNVNEWIKEGNVDSDGTITNIPVKETKNYIIKYKINNWIYGKFYKI